MAASQVFALDSRSRAPASPAFTKPAKGELGFRQLLAVPREPWFNATATDRVVLTKTHIFHPVSGDAGKCFAARCV
jgi:hypothetical protein